MKSIILSDDAVQTGRNSPTIRRNVLPSSSGPKSTSTFLRNVGERLLDYKISHPTRLVLFKWQRFFTINGTRG
jgi:hypothetical protein